MKAFKVVDVEGCVSVRYREQRAARVSRGAPTLPAARAFACAFKWGLKRLGRDTEDLSGAQLLALHARVKRREVVDRTFVCLGNIPARVS